MLFFGATAYVLYIVRSGLVQRNAIKKTRVLAMRAPREMKWAAVNVILHWFAYGLIVVMFATGLMLYLGYGGWWVYVHSTAAFIGLAYIFVHIVAHYMYGGWLQLLRIFNPVAPRHHARGAAEAAADRCRSSAPRVAATSPRPIWIPAISSRSLARPQPRRNSTACWTVRWWQKPCGHGPDASGRNRVGTGRRT